MIGIDTNVLVYLLVPTAPQSLASLAWIESNQEALCVTGTNIAEFLRVVSHPRIYANPMRISDAVDLLRDFFDNYEVTVLSERADWWLSLESIGREMPEMHANDLFDARIAICLRDHRVREIVTFDSDFRKYAFLKTIVPSAS